MLQNSVSRRSLILISLSLLVLAAMTIVLAPKGAQANEGVPIKGNFTVAFAFITNSNACGVDDTCMTCINNSGDYIEAQGIGGTSNQGTLFLEVQKCLNPAGGLFGTYAGTFTMTAPNGKDSLTGMYSGKNDNAGDAYGFGPFSGKITITGGTGKFEGAQGSARFTAVASPNNMAFYSVEGTVSSSTD